MKGGIRQLRLFVLVELVPLLELDPFSIKSDIYPSFGILWDEGELTLFLLNHHKAARPSMTNAATTGPAITPGFTDFPPPPPPFGIHSI
jgi:hypothetical protein